MKRRISAALIAAILILLSACGAKPGDGGELRVGVSSMVRGILCYGQWKMTEADEIIDSLVLGGSPVLCAENGEYSVDKRFVKQIDSEFLPNGDKTYTVELRKNICWSDGSRVTAENYVASVLLFSSPAALNAGASGFPACCYAGSDEYSNGGVFTGVSLVDEFTFSVTVKAEHVPYYWEYSYLDILPIDTERWFPNGVSVTDNGEGCFLTLAELITAEHVTDTLYAQAYENSLGAYVFAGFEDGFAVLEKNPNYIAEDAKSKPKIAKILLAETDGTVSALKNGKVDIVLGVSASEAEIGSFECSDYASSEMLDLVYQCDLGPTGFLNVRRAVSLLCDRQGLASVISGEGATVPEFVFSKPLGEMLLSDFEPTVYSRDINKAAKLLNEDGWVLNAAGQKYSSGLRYKLVSAEEAEDCIDAVTLEDGRMLMPLRLRFAYSDANCSAFFEDLTSSAAEVGMEIVATELEAEVLSDRLTRNASDGIAYAVPLYNGYLIELPVDERGDLSVRWTSDWRAVSEGRNICYFTDKELCDIALRLSFASENREEFSRLLTEHTARWNDTVPELPISQGRVCDVFADKLKGYNSGTMPFSKAVLGAWIESE